MNGQQRSGLVATTRKKKSKVHEAGNYTKPTMRKNLFNKIKAGSSGGRAGQWSARKAQMLAKQYKAAGGGYTQEKLLCQWEKEHTDQKKVDLKKRK